MPLDQLDAVGPVETRQKLGRYRVAYIDGVRDARFGRPANQSDRNYVRGYSLGQKLGSHPSSEEWQYLDTAPMDGTDILLAERLKNTWYFVYAGWADGPPEGWYRFDDDMPIQMHFIYWKEVSPPGQ